MSKSKTERKDKKKSAQLVLRVEKTERDAFVSLCERLDTTAAREIRRFMREMVASHAEEPVTAEPAVAEPAAEVPVTVASTVASTVAEPEAAAPKRRKKAAEPVEPVTETTEPEPEAAPETPPEPPRRRKKTA